jgi:hypothetical protein
MAISSSLGSSALLPAGLGFRNVIINGGMQVAQRGSTFTFGSGSGSVYYGADRWRTQDYTWSAGSNITVSNDSSVYPTGFSNSYKVATGATGLTFGSGGTLFIETSIEGYNASSLYGKSAYLSFWVRSSVTGIYNVLLENGNWGSGTSTRIYTPEYTINSANTWEYKTIPIDFAAATASGTWDRITGKGIGVSFVLGAHADRTGDPYKSGWTTFSSYAGIKTSSAVSWGTNANATFNITGVQLEQNYQPTPFEQRPIGVELALCQRYYYRMSDGGIYAGFAVGYARDTSTATCLVRHPVRMRVKPTSVENSTIALTCRGISGVAISSISYYDGSSDAAMLDVTASGLTQFRMYDLSNNGTAGYLGFSAEL